MRRMRICMRVCIFFLRLYSYRLHVRLCAHLYARVFHRPYIDNTVCTPGVYSLGTTLPLFSDKDTKSDVAYVRVFF